MEEKRRLKWLNIFGTDTLPVLHTHPREVERVEGTILAYDLDVSKLHQGQLDRLSAYIARRDHRPYHEVREIVAEGWTLPATGLMVTVGYKTAVSRRHYPTWKRPLFLLVRYLYAKLSP